MKMIVLSNCKCLYIFIFTQYTSIINYILKVQTFNKAIWNEQMLVFPAWVSQTYFYSDLNFSSTNYHFQKNKDISTNLYKIFPFHFLYQKAILLMCSKSFQGEGVFGIKDVQIIIYYLKLNWTGQVIKTN